MSKRFIRLMTDWCDESYTYLPIDSILAIVPELRRPERDYYASIIYLTSGEKMHANPEPHEIIAMIQEADEGEHDD